MQLLTKTKTKNNNKTPNSCGVIVTRPSFGWETPGANPGKSVSPVVEINLESIYSQDFKIKYAYVIQNLKTFNV